MGARLNLAVLAAMMALQMALPLSFAPMFLLATLLLYLAFRIDIVSVIFRHGYLLRLAIVPSLFRLVFRIGTPYEALLNFIFMLSFAYTPLWFALSTCPEDARRALVSIGMPKRWALAFSMAFASVNFIGARIQKSAMAQKIRGGNAGAGIAIPVLRACFRRAKRLSLSLAARGFEVE